MLTILEKKRIKDYVKYFKEVRKKELEANPLLEIISISVELIKVTEFNFIFKVSDTVICQFEDNKDKSAVSFNIKVCRYSGKTLNCFTDTLYHLENFLDYGIVPNTQA